MTELVQSPHEYLDVALDIIQAEALRSSRVADWDTLRHECHERIADAQTTTDTYSVIEDVLRRLEDGHSFFRTPQRVQEIEHPEKPLNPLPIGRRLASNIGYVELTAVATTSTFDAYVEAAQRVIQVNSNPLIDGWIIDLRRNGGGNMYPMIAGVGAIIGEGTLGSFINVQNEVTLWGYRADGSYIGDTLARQVQISDLSVEHSQLPVAILISPQTKSSGEMLLISFIGREHVKLFGEPTGGYTTANAGYELSDGATIALCISAVADRTGKVYHGPILPDEIVATDWERFGEDDDPVMMAALQWLATLSA